MSKWELGFVLGVIVWIVLLIILIGTLTEPKPIDPHDPLAIPPWEPVS